MKKIPNTIKSLKQAELLLEDDDGTKLWQITDHKYAITRDRQKKPIFAFESEKFTQLLKALNCEIICVVVTKEICQMCPFETVIMGVNLHLKDSSIYSIDYNDNLTKSHIIDL